MKNELERSFPSQEGINPEYIIDFLNACEKAETEIHGIMIARHGKVVFEAYNSPYAADIPHIMHSFTNSDQYSGGIGIHRWSSGIRRSYFKIFSGI